MLLEIASAAISLFKYWRIFLWTGGKCNTSRLPIMPRASPATTGNLEVQQIQSRRNEEKVNNRFW
jgi:hypothetical protein